MSPAKRYVAAFHRQVLAVLNGGLYDLAYDRPEEFREFLIVFWGKIRHSASDKAHFEMVDREIRISVSFKDPLGQNGLARMGRACYKNYHLCNTSDDRSGHSELFYPGGPSALLHGAGALRLHDRELRACSVRKDTYILDQGHLIRIT